MFCTDTIGDCPLCGDMLGIIQTKAHKRFVKCLNENCGKTAYPLPHTGGLEKTGLVCPLSKLPVLAVTPKLYIKNGKARAQEKKTYFWALGPCFGCRKQSTCPVLLELQDEY